MSTRTYPIWVSPLLQMGLERDCFSTHMLPAIGEVALVARRCKRQKSPLPTAEPAPWHPIPSSASVLGIADGAEKCVPAAAAMHASRHGRIEKEVVEKCKGVIVCSMN